MMTADAESGPVHDHHSAHESSRLPKSAEVNAVDYHLASQTDMEHGSAMDASLNTENTGAISMASLICLFEFPV